MDYLARAGFDVFTMDFQGYGSSMRPWPMESACNAAAASQKALLIPNPLSATCSPTYTHPLTSFTTDADEIDTVVQYIRKLRRDSDLRVNLLGWSRGTTRSMVYASLHPEKVAKLFLYAYPILLPSPNISLNVLDQSGSYTNWNGQLDLKNCPNTIEPGIRAAIWADNMAIDPLGASWGKAGILRFPGLSGDGWDDSIPGTIRAPAMIMRGALDTQAPAALDLSLYASLGSERKVYATVACGTHNLVWETPHMVLLDASVEWLRSGRFHGETSGMFTE
jgi:pimeloyl-ACP methyl ester carboxylesterase